MQTNNIQRFIVVHVIPPHFSKYQADTELAELRQLIATYGGATIVRIIQRRDHPDNTTYIGKGKAHELADIVESEKIDVIVINAIAKPTQLFELTRIVEKNRRGIQVWDRVDLIIHIFQKHAHTAEAKMQIELAQMRHMGPRIFGLGYELSRQGGGIGTRGIGETNIERMKRHWRAEIKKTHDELKRLEKNRQRQLERRKERGLQTVSIVGYTNAGKTTLFNSLTGKKKLSKDVLFATLDSTVGKLYLPQLEGEVLVSDTIGFIQNLPAKLIDAFKSTLMESIHADVLIHVIDAADPHMHEKIHVVEEIIEELGIQDTKRIFVFNKIDLIHGMQHHDKRNYEDLYADFHPQFISVRTGEGLDQLKETIASVL